MDSYETTEELLRSTYKGMKGRGTKETIIHLLETELLWSNMNSALEPQRLDIYDSHCIDITGEFRCHHMFSTIIQKENDNFHIIRIHTNTQLLLRVCEPETERDCVFFKVWCIINMYASQQRDGRWWERKKWEGEESNSDKENNRNRQTVWERVKAIEKTLHLLCGTDRSVFWFDYYQLQILPLLSQTADIDAFHFHSVSKQVEWGSFTVTVCFLLH